MLGALGGRDPGSSVDQQAYSEMSREDFDRYINDFTGVEDEILNEVDNPQLRDRKITDARESANSAFDVSEGIASRNASRYNQDLSPDAEAVMKRKFGMQRALATVTAANDTRENVKNNDFASMARSIALGSKLRGEASGLAGSAADAEVRQNDRLRKRQGEGLSDLLSVGSKVAGFFL